MWPFFTNPRSFTKESLPKVTFPESWDVTHTYNHWSNETTTLRYIQAVLLLYHMAPNFRSIKISYKGLVFSENKFS